MAGPVTKNPRGYRNRSPEFLEDLVQSLTASLQANGVKPGEARDIAHECALAQCKNWGGQLIYFPKADALNRDARDLAIYNDFTGHNHGELAQKYDTSVQWIYRIISRIQAAESDRRQGKLFTTSSGSETPA